MFCESGRGDTQERCSIPDNIPVVGVNLSWSNVQGSNFETADLASTSLRGADLMTHDGLLVEAATIPSARSGLHRHLVNSSMPSQDWRDPAGGLAYCLSRGV